MLRVFNCGIGMALVVRDPQAATALLTELGEVVYEIGTIAAHDGPAEVEITLPSGWPA
jgi:phosphoribosylformylglycinamidine cyclo-ligase